MGDDLHNELVATFTYKGPIQHAAALVQRWKSFGLTAIATFGFIWTMFEAPAYLLGTNIRGGRFYLGAVLASVGFALVWAIREYVNDAPSGFEHESRAAQRIAQLQRVRWEYRLAHELLTELLGEVDNELDALLGGRVFVQVTGRPDLGEYIEWVGLAPPNLIRMVAVAQQLLVMDLPTAMATGEQKVRADCIRSTAYRIRDLYKDTVQFERERRSVEPPDGLERLHELQLGWTACVREGVKQMFEFLDKMIAAPRKGDHEIPFTIAISQPANIDGFNRELDNVRRSLGSRSRPTAAQSTLGTQYVPLTPAGPPPVCQRRISTASSGRRYAACRMGDRKRRRRGNRQHAPRQHAALILHSGGLRKAGSVIAAILLARSWRPGRRVPMRKPL